MFTSLVKKLKEVVFFLELKKPANKELANVTYTKGSYRSASSSSGQRGYRNLLQMNLIQRVNKRLNYCSISYY